MQESRQGIQLCQIMGHKSDQSFMSYTDRLSKNQTKLISEKLTQLTNLDCIAKRHENNRTNA